MDLREDPKIVFGQMSLNSKKKNGVQANIFFSISWDVANKMSCWSQAL